MKDALGWRAFRVAEAPALTGDRENFAQLEQRIMTDGERKESHANDVGAGQSAKPPAVPVGSGVARGGMPAGEAGGFGGCEQSNRSADRQGFSPSGCD
jgi:hypothetical protein